MPDWGSAATFGNTNGDKQSYINAVITFDVRWIRDSVAQVIINFGG